MYCLKINNSIRLIKIKKDLLFNNKICYRPKIYKYDNLTLLVEQVQKQDEIKEKNNYALALFDLDINEDIYLILDEKDNNFNNNIDLQNLLYKKIKLFVQ